MGGVERVNLQPAYVLHRRPYRESSLLLDVLTADNGRIGLIAKGARRSRSNQASLLQPFNPILISWSRRGELGTLIDVEMAAPSWPLRAADLISGFYLNELLIRLLGRDDPHPELFEQYAKTLQRLSGGGCDSEWSLRLFEKSLLEVLGYGLLLSHDCDNGDEIQENTRYRYHLERGPVSQYGHADEAELIHGSTLRALENESLPEPLMLKEAKHLMRRTLALYLGERPLRSREIFRQTYKKTTN